MDATSKFRAAAFARGLLLPAELEADGRIHRCKVDGAKSGRADGSYLLHLDGIAAGGFQNFKDGQGWQDWCDDAQRELTSAERAEMKRRADDTRQAREAEERSRQSSAAKRALGLWQRAHPATDAHPYLNRKGVHTYGLRALRERLVIPLRDTDGKLWSLQFIGPDGSKRFLTGGRKRGCYFAIGQPSDVLCIAEGYATGASIFAATGHATAIAFDAGNLQPVAEALRAKFPDARIVLCADNDLATPGNPGISRATAAALAVGGLLAVPSFDPEAT